MQVVSDSLGVHQITRNMNVTTDQNDTWDLFIFGSSRN